jgi:hypothetical protein
MGARAWIKPGHRVSNILPGQSFPSRRFDRRTLSQMVLLHHSFYSTSHLM